jgi:hypothetical protein
MIVLPRAEFARLFSFRPAQFALADFIHIRRMAGKIYGFWEGIDFKGRSLDESIVKGGRVEARRCWSDPISRLQRRELP